MKKVLVGLLAIMVMIIASGYTYYKMNYGGESYYVQILVNGEREETPADDHTPMVIYHYKLDSFNSKGDKKLVKFMASHNLRNQAYLELTYNKHKGVTNWNEVQEKEIPKPALKELQSLEN